MEIVTSPDILNLEVSRLYYVVHLTDLHPFFYQGNRRKKKREYEARRTDMHVSGNFIIKTNLCSYSQAALRHRVDIEGRIEEVDYGQNTIEFMI